MSQNIEIEFKNLLTETEFIRLKKFFHIDESMFTSQDNHYFDTPQFVLKEKGCALRVRFKNDKYELTLKEPHAEGLLETNQALDLREAEKILNHHHIIVGPVQERLRALNIPLEQLTLFGTLTTKRAETKFQNGFIVLDYSTYLNQSDYELEYEVDDYQLGKENFENLLKQLEIPQRPTDNKIRRFYQAKYNDYNGNP
ncbi:CYTH domain-containing protein [Robertmurraya sp. DFI.2.37]|uniref:CYTH domain-containing protein n=1 Tax=Robertmurraya sp. DFI.2.37 TaxID=3031819 RepID=UPI001245A7D8|nr:CYTH domain-containing protein [Robertmurraya sp. DFI.2.37]MDF1507461.1 CYTH domain-containing protein [Robertmurraya sp. DFI.2.37]